MSYRHWFLGLDKWPENEFKTLRRETLDKQKYYNEMHEAGERILNQFGQMEKKNMTRDEAKDKFFGLGADSDFRKNFLDCAERLGLIKFEEPKTVDQRLVDAVKAGLGVRLAGVELVHLKEAFGNAGLKLVEK